MKILKSISYIFLLFVVTSISYPDDISVTNNYSTVNKNIFGVNSLYWINDIFIMKNKKYLRDLKKLNISIMRYPGGEVADNYDWETNTLYNPMSFPYSNSKKDRNIRMNFDEFISWKNKIGSNAILVVDLEEGFVEGNLKKMAIKAADWVYYANKIKKYNIKYWEIGNESYHLGTRYPLTSKQYVKALKLFSKYMKSVDPSIKIGAIGPWRYNKVADIEYLPLELRRKLHSLSTPIERKHFINKYKKTIDILKKTKKVKPSWWYDVFRNAYGYFDFVVLHRYTNIRKNDKNLLKPLRCGIDIRHFRKRMKKISGQEYPIAITEYNVGKKSARGLSDMGLALTIAEMMGEYIKAGVNIANYWPVRLKDKRSMFEYYSLRKRLPYYIFKEYSNFFGSEVLETMSTKDKWIYSIAGRDFTRKYISVFILNKSNKVKKVNLSFYSSVSLLYVYKLTLKSIEESKIRKKNRHISKHFTVILPPKSFDVYRFNIE